MQSLISVKRSLILNCLLPLGCIYSSAKAEFRIEELEVMKANGNFKNTKEGNMNNCLLCTKYSDPDMKSWLKVFGKVAEKHKDDLEGSINFAFLDVEDSMRYGLMLQKFGYKKEEGTKLFFMHLDRNFKPMPKPTFYDAPLKFGKFDEGKFDEYVERIDEWVTSVVDGSALVRGDRLMVRDEL